MTVLQSLKRAWVHAWRETYGAMQHIEQPKGCRYVRADGTTVPVELLYAGFHEGTHHWVTDVTEIEPGGHYKFDTLPARTTIHLKSRLKLDRDG